MPDTFEAVGIFILAVLPGALYVLAVEREVGRWGVRLTDRILRFLAISALFQAAYTVPLYLLRNEYWHHKVPGTNASFENRVQDGDSLPLWLYLVPLAYVGIPIALGALAGRATRGKSKAAQTYSRLMVGRDPEPRAWDHLFWNRPSGYVRLRLKNDEQHPWAGGLFGEHSYAAGYPEEPQDLYLESTYEIDSEGVFATTPDGDFVELGSALLIRWEEVDLLEFFHVEPEAEDANG